jgi:hypothetical protein
MNPAIPVRKKLPPQRLGQRQPTSLRWDYVAWSSASWRPPGPDRVTVAASSAVGVPAATTVGDNSTGVAAGGADDVGAAVACSP